MLPALLAAIPAIAGAAGNAASSAIGASAAGASREQQARILREILDKYAHLSVPEQDAIIAEQLGPSAQESVRGQMDPRLKSAQMDTLAGLDQYAQEGGNAETKAAMQRVLGDLARQESAGRNQVMAGMRARGVANSGADLAAQLSNQQASAERAQTAGLNQAAEQQRRMYQAMVQRGAMAGDMRGQDYRELTDAARAKDMIDQYNAQGREKAKYYNAGLSQQKFQNQLQLTNSMANAANGVANSYGQAADRAAAMGAGIGNGLGQIGSTVSTELNKKDQKDPYATWTWPGGTGGTV